MQSWVCRRRDEMHRYVWKFNRRVMSNENLEVKWWGIELSQTNKRHVVCMKLRRPSMTNALIRRASGWHRNCFQANLRSRFALTSTVCMNFQKSKRLLLSEASWCDQNLNRWSVHIDLRRLAQTPKKHSPGSDFYPELQVDFGVDRPSPANSRRSLNFDHNGTGNGKKQFRKMIKSETCSFLS